MYEKSGSNTEWILPLILLCLAGILINVIISLLFYKIAKEKGHISKEWFFACFFFGPVGWIMVWALPDRGGNGLVEERTKEEKE